MKLPSESLLLRIFISETDKFQGRPLYKAIVEEARKRGMAGATVLRGILGFGANSRIHTSQILRLSQDLPLVIEIVDSEQRINEFLPELEHMISEGLVTLERAQVIAYRHNNHTAGS
jgi:hypothetical protein